MPTTFTSTDHYISTFPESTQQVLTQIRTTIAKLAPDAKECISYNIPCFRLNGTYLVYFAGYKKHVSLYPVPTDHPDLAAECAGYKTSGKGTLQFPLGKPLPVPLIQKVMKVMLERNAGRSA